MSSSDRWIVIQPRSSSPAVNQEFAYQPGKIDEGWKSLVMPTSQRNSPMPTAPPASTAQSTYHHLRDIVTGEVHVLNYSIRSSPF